MERWLLEAKNIKPLDASWRKKARQRLAEQTRPQGSLGVLESLLERLAAIQKTERLDVSRKRILIFAADHGVHEEKVSAYPREVTKAMVLNFLNGGATINALGRHAGAEVCVIDVGVDADFGNESKLIHAKIAAGTRNMTREPAMTGPELDKALRVGWEQVYKARRDGIQLLALGEMGIGNTTAASAVVAALIQKPVSLVTGRGTGLDDAGLLRKIDAIQRALELHKNSLTDPLHILRCVGGYEIAAMTGAILAAAAYSIPIIIDGWIVSASALAAIHLNSHVLDYLFFAHQSEECGHRVIFETLEVQPVFNLSMRLGEASGAALAMNVLEAMVRVYNETATFTEAGVARREQ